MMLVDINKVYYVICLFYAFFFLMTILYLVRKVWKEYSPYVDAIVYLIDVTERERFFEAKHELDNLLVDESLQSTPIVVFGNKIDKFGAAGEQEIRDLLNIPKFNASENYKRPIELFMTSLLCKEGYGEAFKWLVQYI